MERLRGLTILSKQDTNTISIWNNGDGVPVEMHKEENVYVPELIFGHLLTSSNYDDDEKKVSHRCAACILLSCYGATCPFLRVQPCPLELTRCKRLDKLCCSCELGGALVQGRAGNSCDEPCSLRAGLTHRQCGRQAAGNVRDCVQVTGGRNGYGAKLANIFSTEFIIETCDGKSQYKQVHIHLSCLSILHSQN